MADRAKQRCRVNGCSVLTRSASGYCEQHEIGHRKEKGDFKKADPIYLSSRWRKLRERKLMIEPLCELCGGVTVATIVHHKREIKAGGDPFNIDNLQSICQECHNRLHKGRGRSHHKSLSKSTNRLVSDKYDAEAKSILGPGGKNENR